ncbi:MAG: trigger factor [Clostridia bacterium]|nr:trigger factor [Clostridia bacterium]MBP3495303.1 trigger factor [Clostridia bacterium]
MALKSTNKVETNLYEIEFDASKEVFDAAVEKVYRKEVKKINIPGFRKGKAPRSIIEKMYGKGVFYEDAVNEIIPDAYESAVKEAGLDVVSRPEFDVVSIDDNGVVLKAKFYVKPEVTVKEYKGLNVTKEVKSVTDEDVNNEIESVRARNSRVVDVEGRSVENGDIAVIDFDGYVDGVAFEGGKSENYNLTIGSGSFIPGFEEQIIGHNVGDSFDVNVTFPTEYHASELAGKEAVFKIVLHAIKFNELPALDDEFAKDVSEFDTLDEYKADVKAKLENKNVKAAENAVEEQLINALIENLEAEIPAPMFENEAENFVRDYDSRLRMQGLDLNTYCKYTGQTLDSLREQFKPMAERQVKTRLALEKIVELEGITASEEEINNEYENLAKAYGMTADKVKELVDADAIKADLSVKKAVDFVKENANVTVK